ncbi:ATP-dependent helicase [Bacillus haynesii]|uniref:UvrD-helicase domain-containing protein n=2 Tax=Bacillus haynesii TaxID=1925021 RepID=UPI0022822E4B|nr:ATP-dependent helicase [Bacillus haynesii]MCY8000483.1 ATP-dependent helicase [Bacillus haynesii]MCY8356155.1 ATP-dependent helicase [Bacillus haynesii]MCY8554935.1 ATP-dependent helicase [Bacillus haynesii]
MGISIKEWKPSDGLILESAALNAVNDLNNSLVVAGPGAGKTELLAQKACFLLETNSCVNPSKILAISFKKDAAVNLKDRIKLRLPKNLESRFISQTFDSFSKSILDRFLYALPEEFRPDPNYEIAENQNECVRAFSKCGANLYNNKIKKQYIDNLTKRRIEHVSGVYKDVWDKLLKGDGDIKPTLSFQMISVLAIYILETNPLILKSLRKTYSHVFLDEFQDTTRLQYALVKVCFHNSEASITAVGDHRQRIMLWAGAKPDIFDSYKNDFNSQEYTLVMNHRSAPRLLEIQKTVNNYLQDIPISPIANPKWTEDEGVAEIWYFKDSFIEAEHVAERITQLIHQQQISYRDICIIVKQSVQQFSDEIIGVLEKVNIQARNEVQFQYLLKEDIVLLILNTLKSALDVRDSDSWSFIWEAKTFFEGKSGTVNPLIIDELRKQLKLMLRIVKSRLMKITHQEELNILLMDIVDFYNVNKIRKYYPQYSQGQYINKLRENLTDYLYQYYLSKNDWIAAIDSFQGNDSIPIMTIHKSKGLEFDVVFFVGFDDNSFWSFSDQEDEDKCTFFVGLSRSKRYLYFTFSENRFGRRRTNSDISILYHMLEESGVVEEKYIGFD